MKYIKLWWHCLLHFHKSSDLIWNGKKFIWCKDCGYGLKPMDSEFFIRELERISVKRKNN